MSTSVVDILLRARNMASKELNNVTGQLKTLDRTAKMALGGISSLAGGFAVMEATKFAVSMAQLNTQVERSTFAFEHFSGGAAQAAANLRAVQRASGGTLSTLDAQNVAVVGLTQNLASNSQELEKMTRIARGIVAVSPIINDMETAFSQLGLTIANQSMMRLDQLGTSAVEVRAKMAELKAETKGLTDEQAFQDALMSILESKFDTLTDAAINQASGLEILRKAWIDYRITASESFGWVDNIARRLGNELNVETQLRAAYNLIDNLPPVISPEQQAVIKDVQSILDDPIGSADNWIDLGTQLDELIDKFYELGDARTNFFKGMAVGPKINFPVNDPMFTTDQDQARLQTLEDFNKEIEKLIDTQARAAQVRLFENTGNIEQASAAYDTATSSLEYWVAKQQRAGIELEVIKALLPSAAQNLLGYADATDTVSQTVADMTDQLSKAIAQDVYRVTGNPDEAIAAYEKMKSALLSWVQAQQAAGRSHQDVVNLLPIEAQRVRDLEAAFVSILGDINLATGSINDFADALAIAGANMAGLIAMREQFGSAATASEYQYFGPGMDPATGTYEDRIAELQRERKAKQEAWREEYAATQSQRELSLRSAREINTEYEKVKSTISGIVSGAIGPVAGVDANDLLPRPDAVNENARRLADIAVNGFKGQDWLGEFAMEAPDVFEQLKNSSDPKGTAAQILKDFQDGLRPDLIDKERAKELVKRALQGDANTSALVDEIAGELASELGISLSEAKAKAGEVLGGGESGATGVSLAPKIDSTAASGAASTFASAFTTAINDSTLGADLSGAVYAQVTASITLIEQTGTEAGNALVRGMSATFAEIPQNLIAALAGMVLPLVQAGIASQGTRTGAAAS